jgi:hypothetical protein
MALAQPFVAISAVRGEDSGQPQFGGCKWWSAVAANGAALSQKTGKKILF